MSLTTKNLATVFVGVGLVLAMAFAFAAPASAATISDPLFSNGQTSIDATGGSTVNGTFTLTVGVGEVVEWLRTTPDTQPFTEASVGGQLGYQEGVHLNVPFSAKVPPNTGTYNVNVQGAGTFGGNRSINGGDNVVVGPTSVGSVRVVASGGGSVGGVSLLEQLQSTINGLIAQIGCMQTGGTYANNVCTPKPVDTKPSYCASIVWYNGSNAWAAQQSLLSTPHASHFHDIGVYSPTGKWLNASKAASAAAMVACSK